MKTNLKSSTAVLLMCIFLFLTDVHSANSPSLYVIYDSSNSMWGVLPDKKRKYEAAQSAMDTLMRHHSEDQTIALRIYGHRHKSDCTDSELVVPFGQDKETAKQMVQRVTEVRPKGKTPIHRSLTAALKDFGNRSGSIILISDGIESCDADPCELVREWQNQGVTIKVHVVGLGLKGKERTAMQCIAEASGTHYHDAYSAGELAESLLEVAAESEAIAPGDVKPAVQDTLPDFKLVVTTEDGVRQRGLGKLVPVEGGAPIPVETFQRYTPPPGDYTLIAGVAVLGKQAFQPVSTPVTVEVQGRTVGTVNAVRPPQVNAVFSMEGDALRASVVTVYREGKKIGSFKGDESAFVPIGTLEFKAKPGGTSNIMSVTETFAAGDNKTISFNAATEVHVTIVAKASSTGEVIKSKPNVKLLQGGSVVSTLNSHSGGLAIPGQYRINIDDGLNSFEQNIEVTADRTQAHSLTIPTGTVKVSYQDATGQAEKDKRVFFKRLTDGRRSVRQSGQPIALVPGNYEINGHPKKAGYPSQLIEIKDETAVEVILQRPE